MKQLKVIFVRTIPILIIAIITLSMLIVVYQAMIESEEENCWENLDISAKTMSEKVNICFTDNLNILEHVADALAFQINIDYPGEVVEYLSKVRDTTIFERIDILFPDNSLLLQTGDYSKVEGKLPYDEVLVKGTHVSYRRFDDVLKKDAVYCVAPIERYGVDKGLLIGVVSCERLGEMFISRMYEGDAQVLIIDRANGDYLINRGSKVLGNINDISSRTLLEGYENVNFCSEIMSGISGNVAFISGITGEPLYMSYMPVPGYNMEVCVTSNFAAVFENVISLRETLGVVSIVEAAFVVLYIIWNVILVYGSVKNEEKARLAEIEKARNAAKSIFLSSVSHDIRTPLNGIVGMLEMIERHGNEPGVTEDCLKKIKVSAKYLNKLATDVLDINELESGNLVLNEDSIDLCEMAEDITAVVSNRAENAGVSYSIDYSKIKNKKVIGSSTHLNRIIVNLIGNAIKYNKPNGSVWVTMQELDIEDGVGNYQFIVKDNGIGISESFQNKLFLPFEQAEVTARTVNKGYGLGLAIVNRFVQLMGGNVTVKSTEGEGSEFTVTVPLKIDTEAVSETPKFERDAFEKTQNTLLGLNVLLVEDNELNMEIAKAILDDSGVKAVCAENGRRALEIFEDSKPFEFDMVLMDIMMPEMDGCEATEKIRKLQRPDVSTIPIIAMTATAFSEDIKRCKDAGMNDSISKPIDSKMFLATISKNRGGDC